MCLRSIDTSTFFAVMTGNQKSTHHVLIFNKAFSPFCHSYYEGTWNCNGYSSQDSRLHDDDKKPQSFKDVEQNMLCHHLDIDQDNFCDKNAATHASHILHTQATSHFAGCIIQACSNSQIFCKNFLQYVWYHDKDHIINRPTTAERKHVNYMIVITVLEQEHLLDYNWCRRICCLVYRRIIHEDTMSWLNTLGGGYSALGDYSNMHAETAGGISLKQLKISCDMGDEPSAMRCWLYMSLSLMQTEQLRKAKYIIRHTYHCAQNLPVEDVKLLSMCQGIWSRLRYLYTQKTR